MQVLNQDVIINSEVDLDAPQVGLFNSLSHELVPIKFVDVKVEIQDNFAKVFINQLYENLYSKVIDTEFIFPKTKNAIFDSLKASLDNDEIIVAEIFSKEEGNKRFEEAKNKGDLAVLVQIDKKTPDLIKTKIGNLAPGQKVKITFSYVTQLDITLDKAYQFKFANIFIPRYTSNKNNKINYLENPINYEILTKIRFISEADIGGLNEQFEKILINQNSISNVKNNNLSLNNNYLDNFENFFLNHNKDFVQFCSGEGVLYPWAMKIIINTSFKFTNLKCHNNLKENNANNSLFHININDESNNATLETNLINFDYPKTDVIISFEDHDNFKTPFLMLNQHPLNRNEFSLYFKFNPRYLSEAKSNAVPVADEVSNDSNYLFFIDRSGSMSGKRIETAKNSLVYFLKSLPEESKFNIISFGSNDKSLYNDFIKADDITIKKALNEVNKFDANMGGTELFQPFKKIFDKWKKNLKGNEKIRIFVLTDGSIDSPDKFLKELEDNNKYFLSKNIDLRIYSLGIGSGCSEYLIKGIAEKGNGKSELALNNDDIIEKVIYLLENSLNKNLKNFKIYFEDNQTLNDSLIANSDIKNNLNIYQKSFTETIEFFCKIDFDDSNIKNLDNTNLICSYIDVDNNEEKFIMPLSYNLIKDDDTLFKIWLSQKVEKFFEEDVDKFNFDIDNVHLLKKELINLSIKYQSLNRLTSLFMVLKEKNIEKEDLNDKKYVSLANSDLSEIDINTIFCPTNFISNPSPCIINYKYAEKKKKI